jgi:hypothetical protein
VTSFLYQHRLAIAATVLVVCILLAVYAWSQLYLAARDRWRSRTERKARAAQAATPAAQETGPEPVAPADPAVHEGATEAYGDQLAAHRAALTLTDIPIVDDTDTGAAILRVRRHVDDILVALVGDDAEQLAAVRKAADVTGQWDGRGLWALLAAEDAEAQLVGAGVPR